MAHDNDPGDCNDFWTKRYNALNTTAAIDDALHGRLGDTPATERERIEEALAHYSDDNSGWPSKHHPYMAALREAARKHLETLPKPERYSVSVIYDTGSTSTVCYETAEEAATAAAKRYRCYTGVSHVVIRKVS
jgi:molybdopterin-guanine dinucleotide biosynthesis protein A